MSALTVSSLVVEARPSAVEVAVLHLPPGSLARVHHPDRTREYTPGFPDIPYYVVVPGDNSAIGWGWNVGWYGSLTGVRNGRHRLDRDAWHAAAKALRSASVVYVRYEALTYYSATRWTAVGVRVEGTLSLPEQTEEPAHV
ncbi:hypothetical protein OG884_18315 [Streptosporangium sp. NBC_01755]|uniref:hypothetical protein n=1 Tax=Streptosporangium sp. NBC_01755 TaxID=2975949 RepID=UPI002DD7A763|nr:hypothetical protein [Streptosporangium sp. NBC_01755]WSD03761.1 hypothetical protein OG884_18315 [Streptosporangium sp. NBC_01755]